MRVRVWLLGICGTLTDVTPNHGESTWKERKETMKWKVKLSTGREMYQDDGPGFLAEL